MVGRTGQDVLFAHSVTALWKVIAFPSKSLLPGHYLYVTARENELQCELESVDNLKLLILNNHRDLQLVFLDLKGNEIKTLKPEIGHRVIPFDNNLNIYKIQLINYNILNL